MKTRALLTFVLAAAFTMNGNLFASEEKTAGEKSAEAWDKTKETTKEVTNAVVKKTKETVAAVERKVDQPDADAKRVNVQVTDQGVQMPKSLAAGKTAFIVKNTGKQKHNFKVTGAGLDEGFWFSIAPGSDKTMQVDLRAGSYEAVCSLSDHAGKEAKTLLAVK